MFRVQVNAALGLFETAMIGFWSLEDVREFGAAVAAAARRIQQETGAAPISICDYTRAETQSREVAEALAAMMRNPPVRSRRVAIITRSPLARLQARRLVAERPEIAFVDTRDEALAWVLATGDAAPRAA